MRSDWPSIAFDWPPGSPGLGWCSRVLDAEGGSQRGPARFSGRVDRSQIWIVPDKRGLKPAYGQQAFERDRARESFLLLASKEGREKSIQVEQDVDVWMTQLAEGERRDLPLQPGRGAWVHVARGSASLNGSALHEGDGAAVNGEELLRFLGGSEAEVLVFDLK